MYFQSIEKSDVTTIYKTTKYFQFEISVHNLEHDSWYSIGTFDSYDQCYRVTSIGHRIAWGCRNTSTISTSREYAAREVSFARSLARCAHSW